MAGSRGAVCGVQRMEPAATATMTQSQVAAVEEAEDAAEEARARAAEASLDLVEQLLEAYFMQVGHCRLAFGYRRPSP